MATIRRYAYDSFARGGVDVLSISSVRVAGVGGAGLMVVAAVTAVQFPLISAVLLAGALGGALVGAALILCRPVRKVVALRDAAGGNNDMI